VIKKSLPCFEGPSYGRERMVLDLQLLQQYFTYIVVVSFIGGENWI
jgi:hypothetical protein